MSRIEQIGDATLYLGDCREILPTLDFDVVVSDPPYPDYLADEYSFDAALLPSIPINKGMIFWSSKCDFPLEHSAVHIWDKKTGCGSEYERIFEIGGAKNFKVFRHYFINSTVAASFTGDVFTGHKSQKPIGLMLDVVAHISDIDQTILDPFMGSGSSGVACLRLGRSFIGIEQNPKWFDVACKRIAKAHSQPDMFIAPPVKATQEALL